MRYNSYTLYFRRSDNTCYRIVWNGVIKPFNVDKTVYTIQHDNGMYISRPYFDLVHANATVYTVRVAIREDSEFFNFGVIWEVLFDTKLDAGYPLEKTFGEEIQRLYYKEIETIIADAIEI